MLSFDLNDAQLAELARRVAELLPVAESTPWLDTKGAAEHLACSTDRVHDLVALRKLTPRRDGRRLLFKRQELDDYLETSV